MVLIMDFIESHKTEVLVLSLLAIVLLGPVLFNQSSVVETPTTHSIITDAPSNITPNISSSNMSTDVCSDTNLLPFVAMAIALTMVLVGGLALEGRLHWI